MSQDCARLFIDIIYEPFLTVLRGFRPELICFGKVLVYEAVGVCAPLERSAGLGIGKTETGFQRQSDDYIFDKLFVYREVVWTSTFR